jgi:hypothetical protein
MPRQGEDVRAHLLLLQVGCSGNCTAGQQAEVHLQELWKGREQEKELVSPHIALIKGTRKSYEGMRYL